MHVINERDSVRFNVDSLHELDLHRLENAWASARTIMREESSDQTRSVLISSIEEAAQLCRDEFLEGFSLPDAPDFDDWMSTQREIWRRRMESVLDQLSRLRAEAAEHHAAIEVASRWLSLSPLNEEAHRRLMQLHFARGDRTAALRAYERCRAVLARELQTTPAPETEALAERLRSQVPTPRRRTASIEQAPRPEAAEPLRVEAPLVGRAEEFTRLVQHFYAVRQGRAQVVAIQGEAGIGKTRLGTEFLAWAIGQGADVLKGRAFETGGRLPYQPLVDALRPRIERENAPDDLLGDIWLVELSRLLPEIRDRYPDLLPPPPDETTARTRLYEAVTRLGQALADRAPVVMFVDDLQWADAASLDVLHYAARRWVESNTPVLLLLCLRSEALTEAQTFSDWVGGLERDFAVVRLELGPLNLEDTAELVRQLGVRSSFSQPEDVAPQGVEAFSRWLFSETGGQPLFLAETIRTLLDRGILVSVLGDHGDRALEIATGPEELGPRRLLPPGVQQVLRARLVRLTPNARAHLAAAAVLGQGFRFEPLARVASLSETEALSALDELLRARLLREGGTEDQANGAYFFAHDKIRDVAYGDAGEARRRVFHRRALDLLEPMGPAAELAHHALAGGLEEAAGAFSLRAGDDAMRLLAARDAIAHYDRARAIAERLNLSGLVTEAQARRAKAFASVGMWSDARRDLEETIASVGKERRAELLVDLSEACFWLLDVPSVRRHAEESVDLAGQLGRNDLKLAGMGWLGGADSADGELQSCIEQYGRVVGLAQDLGVPPPAHVLTLHSLVSYWLGRLELAAERSREGVSAARNVNDASVMMYSLPHLGLALASSGRYAEATQVFEEARRFGRDYQINTLLARAISMSTGFHLDLFDFARAEELANEARELALSANFPPTVASASIDLLFIFARSGEVGKAEKLADAVAETVQKAAGFHGWLWRLRLSEARAEIALARGDWEEALQWADDALAQSRAKARLKYQVIALRTRALALRALSREPDSINDLKNALQSARTMLDPALFLHTAATLLAIDGTDVLAREARTALERIIAALPDPLMRARFERAEPVRIIAATGSR